MLVYGTAQTTLGLAFIGITSTTRRSSMGSIRSSAFRHGESDVNSSLRMRSPNLLVVIAIAAIAFPKKI